VSGGENGTEVGGGGGDGFRVQRHGACDCAVTPARRFWHTHTAAASRHLRHCRHRHRLWRVTAEAFACGLRIMHYNIVVVRASVYRE